MRYESETRGQNFYDLDVNLQAVLRRRTPVDPARWGGTLADFGAWVGSEVDAQAAYTDRHGKPALETYDRDGETVNRIVHNPAWEQTSAEAYRRGVVGLNYTDDPAPYSLTFAMGYLLSQADTSLHCPVTMTGAVAYVLDRFAPADVRGKYLHRLTRMDGKALTGGTWATEQHGGSDVGATTTVATPADDGMRLTGLKWFASNVNGGLALATARPAGAPDGSKGLGVYLVPTHLDDGRPNAMRIRRLKDKLGTCGVPTGEVDLLDAYAVEVAPPPAGFKLMMEALEFSRIHNAVGSAGLHRRAFLEAISYCSHRVAFGHTITDYPMVQNELLDVMVQLEAGMTLAFEAAAAFDAAHAVGLEDADDDARIWLRLVTALAKYFTAEEVNVAARAAIEIIGGNAYTYDYCTPRLLRDAQALTVWEGPANIQALELLRLLDPRHGGFDLFDTHVRKVVDAAPADLADQAAIVTQALQECRDAVGYIAGDAMRAQRHARKLLQLMADVMAAAMLLDEAREDLADGDARKALVSRLFLEARLQPPARRGIGPDQEWTDRYFWPLVGYEPVDSPRDAHLHAVG